MAEDMEKRVGQYLALRDEIERIEKQHEEELKRPKELLHQLGGVIQKFMDDNGLKNMRTDAGTAVINTRWSAPLSDPDAFMRFVIENEQFDLLERRASQTAVRAYVDEHKALPAGVNLHALETVGVRRPPNHPKS